MKLPGVVAAAVCAGALSLSSEASAQPRGDVEDAPTVRLGLTEALRLALRRDARVAVAAARVRVAQARRAEAAVGYLPDVLVGAGYTAGFPGSGSNLMLRGMLSSPFFRTYVAGVDASWNVIDLLRSGHSVNAAEASAEAASAERESTAREVALALVDVFEEVLAAEERSAVLEVEVSTRQQLIGALESRVAAGTLPGEQLFIAQAGLGDAQAERARALADSHGARAALRALVADDRALTASLVLDARPRTGDNPEARVARALRRQAAETNTLRRMEWIPRVTLAGSVGYANPAPGNDPGYYALGAAVALPITQVLRQQSQHDRESAALEARALEADATAQQLAVRVAQIDASIAGLEASVPTVHRGRELADAAYAAVAARASSGLVAAVDLEAVRATQRRAQARESLLRIHLDGLRARRVFLVTSR